MLKIQPLIVKDYNTLIFVIFFEFEHALCKIHVMLSKNWVWSTADHQNGSNYQRLMAIVQDLDFTVYLTSWIPTCLARKLSHCCTGVTSVTLGSTRGKK